MSTSRSSMTMRLVVAASALALGFDLAYAGPGGGTYYANSPAGGASGKALRKFVDSLPGLGPQHANNLGQYIPIAHPDTLTYPGSDYYEIALKDYEERMHSDLPKATRLRGYVQVNQGTNAAGTANDVAPEPQHYLGPLIIADRDRPVRVKFINKLGKGDAGNLFIPVDHTLMGTGMGPLSFSWNPDTRQFDPTGVMDTYTENRGELHLHGGFTPWISDGTPHQWITPPADPTPYKRGISQINVPDMPDAASPKQGEATYYYTNAQSSRLMFYHDHALGMTRLNVYAGEAAAYLLRDDVEKALEANGTLPDLAHNIPLVIQDKTFVPEDVAFQDALWDTAKWGQPGDLWFPHVYETNQDPTQQGGMSATGRWDYGPWFWPPALVKNPVLPEVSIVPEAFMDTALVNGTAYPYATVEPRRYRFRILNACNDRTINLQLYLADPAYPEGTEVAMVPSPDGRRGGVPDETLVGPAFIHIGTEGGFLPEPHVANDPTIQPIYVGYDTDPRSITINNINRTNLLLGPAQRADVIVDFSKLAAGTKLILYNDAPAPAPAGDARVDYFTGHDDQSAVGGAPPTLPGYGPNTRTIMQFRVVPLVGDPDPETHESTLAKLSDPAPGSPTGLKAAFDKSQDPLLFPIDGVPVENYTQYVTDVSGKSIPVYRKAIQELFDPVYGRMNALLGTELQWTNGQNQNTNFSYYTDLPTEIIPDGQTQAWMIVHNGVDTHFVHFHLFNVQVLGRVDWAGVVKPPYADERGWRDTIRADPLEQVIVAMKPVPPPVPFSVPDSIRPLDVTMPATSGLGVLWNATANPNPTMNFGQEYVWHCHLLGHEENDMMRPMIFLVPTDPPKKATNVAAAFDRARFRVNVTWQVDETVIDEIAYRVERREGSGDFAKLADVQYVHNMPQAFFPNGQPNWPGPSYTDATVEPGKAYSYRIVGYNTKGQTASDAASVDVPTVTPASGVTVTPSKPTPHVMGTSVVFTASGRGSTDAYDYRFSLDDGTSSKVLQDYGAGATWAMPASTPVGNYTVRVDVRTNPRVDRDASTALAYAVRLPPATGVTLTADKPSPQPIGAPVTFTAAAKGSTGYQYRFFIKEGSSPTYMMVQDYGVGSTWTLPSSLAVGTYRIVVHVRTSALVALDAQAGVNYTLAPAPATAVALSAGEPSPRLVGTPVVFTASATSPFACQYRFFLKRPGSTVFELMQDWSATSTWTLATSLGAGTYRVVVHARTSTSSSFDVQAGMNYTLSLPPATGVTITADLSSPQLAGTPVVFTASGAGSSDYQYRFFLKRPGSTTFELMQDYGVGSTWTLPSSLTPGAYRVVVHVRTSAAVSLDAQAGIDYTLAQ